MVPKTISRTPKNVPEAHPENLEIAYKPPSYPSSFCPPDLPPASQQKSSLGGTFRLGGGFDPPEITKWERIVDNFSADLEKIKIRDVQPSPIIGFLPSMISKPIINSS